MAIRNVKRTHDLAQAESAQITVWFGDAKQDWILVDFLPPV